MPIICFEGASAVGKSTVSTYLQKNFGAFVVAEVNFLFERKEREPQFWYFERQIERWKMARRAAKRRKIVILDGDAFQPLWYNWSYDYDFGEPFAEISGFYQKVLAAGEIDFPDKYFIFTVEGGELHRRKTNDASRTRKNFERHLRFIEPQIAYFNFIKSVNENLVEFVENREAEETGRKIINSVSAAVSNNYSSIKLFEAVKNWLAVNNAEDFKS